MVTMTRKAKTKSKKKGRTTMEGRAGSKTTTKKKTAKRTTGNTGTTW